MSTSSLGPALSTPLRRGVIAALGGACMLLAACGQAADDADRAGSAAEDQITVGGPFSLVDSTGAPVTDEDLLGRPFVVYFGFTYCPDVCPLALNKLALALDMLEPEQAAQVRSVFITVDPERDTPEQLALYIDNYGFPEDLIGLTGAPEQIRAVADAYRVHYKKIESRETTAPYLMEHTSVLYLMDADGRLAGVFTHASTPEEIADGLRRQLAGG